MSLELLAWIVMGTSPDMCVCVCVYFPRPPSAPLPGAGTERCREEILEDACVCKLLDHVLAPHCVLY